MDATSLGLVEEQEYSTRRWACNRFPLILVEGRGGGRRISKR